MLKDPEDKKRLTEKYVPDKHLAVFKESGAPHFFVLSSENEWLYIKVHCICFYILFPSKSKIILSFVSNKHALLHNSIL